MTGNHDGVASRFLTPIDYVLQRAFLLPSRLCVGRSAPISTDRHIELRAEDPNRVFFVAPLREAKARTP